MMHLNTVLYTLVLLLLVQHSLQGKLVSISLPFLFTYIGFADIDMVEKKGLRILLVVLLSFGDVVRE